MGIVSFLLPESLTPDAERCLNRASLVGGYDLTPVPAYRRIRDGVLTLTKDASESGYVSLPWPLPGLGEPLCRSSTLRERTEPYNLLIELARGELNQVRTQTAEWQMIGLEITDADRTELRAVVHQFGTALFADTPPESDRLSQDVLARTYRLGERIARTFADQLFHTRLCETGKLPTRLGCRLSRVPPPEEQELIRETFSAVRLVPEWRTIEATESHYDWSQFDALVEWAEEAGLAISAGPLIDLGGVFPDWFRQWSGDLPSVAAFTCDFVETTIRRYQGRIGTWQVFAGVNHQEALGLTEDDRIRLAARLLDSARQADPLGTWVAGIAQPWGDYLGSDEHTYSPLVFADTLMRAGFNLAAIELELLIAPGTRGSWPRDPLEVFRVLELFGVLGVPLEVSLGTSLQSSSPSPDGWAETALGVALALPQVVAVYWETWADDSTARVPGVALMEAGSPAALVDVLRGLRQRALE